MAAKKGSAAFVSGILKEVVEAVVVKVSVNATAQLGEDTPRDTGWAASNWVPSIGPGSLTPFGSKLAVSEAAKEAGLAILVSTYALPQLVHITNPVDYILKLNDGTHSQHPKFFVETAIAKAIKSVV